MSSTVKIKGFVNCYIHLRYCGFLNLACFFICSVLSYLRTLGIITLGEIRENYSGILPKLLPSAITNGKNILAPRWYAESKDLQTSFYCNMNVS